MATKRKEVRRDPCEMCGKIDKLVKYRKMNLCGACMNPEIQIKYGDANHPLVTSNLRMEGR